MRRFIDAPVTVDSNSVRLRCRFDVQAPGHDELWFIAQWNTEPVLNTTVSADISATSSFSPPYSFATTWTPLDSSRPEPFSIAFYPDVSPCDELCSFDFEVTVRVTGFPDLGAVDIPASFRVGVVAFKTTDSDIPEGTITLDCDPVEHLDLPSP